MGLPESATYHCWPLSFLSLYPFPFSSMPSSLLINCLYFCHYLWVPGPMPCYKTQEPGSRMGILWTSISAYDKVTFKIFSSGSELWKLFKSLSWCTKTSHCLDLQLYIPDIPLSCQHCFSFTTTTIPAFLPARLHAGGRTLAQYHKLQGTKIVYKEHHWASEATEMMSNAQALVTSPCSCCSGSCHILQ